MQKKLIWVDAQLSPIQALWLNQNFPEVETISVRQLQLRDATDSQIYHAAREANAIVLTKDIDFVHLQKRLGPPPVIIWVTSGNTSNARMQQILIATLSQTLRLFEVGEWLVEVR